MGAAHKHQQGLRQMRLIDLRRRRRRRHSPQIELLWMRLRACSALAPIVMGDKLNGWAPGIVFRGGSKGEFWAEDGRVGIWIRFRRRCEDRRLCEVRRRQFRRGRGGGRWRLGHCPSRTWFQDWEMFRFQISGMLCPRRRSQRCFRFRRG